MAVPGENSAIRPTAKAAIRFSYGEGPIRVLFVHGWFGDATCFKPILQGIDPQRFSFAFVDIRGYGDVQGSDGPYDMATIAGDLLDLADGLGWQKFSLVGHSMGGKAVLKTATVAPDRVERLCAITPVWAGVAPFNSEMLAFFRSAADSVEARAGIVRNSTGGRLPLFWSRIVADASFQIASKQAFAKYFESWALDDFEDEAAKVANETLVVAGRHDGGISEELVRKTWIKSLTNARLVVLPESGHYPMDECPLFLAETISNFLDPSVT